MGLAQLSEIGEKHIRAFVDVKNELVIPDEEAVVPDPKAVESLHL